MQTQSPSIVNCLANMHVKLSYTTMTSAPQIQPKFLPNRHDLGVVAVGFSGGQVSTALSLLTSQLQLTQHSRKPALTQRPKPSSNTV
jgi:hypothetical protein